MKNEKQAVQQLLKDAERVRSLQLEVRNLNQSLEQANADLRSTIFECASWGWENSTSTAELLREFRKAFGRNASVEEAAALCESLRSRYDPLVNEINALEASLDERAEPICIAFYKRTMAEYKEALRSAIEAILPFANGNRQAAHQTAVNLPVCREIYKRVWRDYRNFQGDPATRVHALARIMQITLQN